MKLPAQARRHWLLIAILLLATFGVRSRLGASPSIPLREPLSAFPDQVGNWSLLSQPAMTPDVVQVLNADDYTLRIYQNPQGAQAQFFVAYYRTQRAGESMHSPKNCLPGAGWEPIRSDTIPFPTAGGDARINRYVVEKGTDRDLALYWYQAQGRIIASEYAGKFYLIWDAMRTGRRDGAIVRVLLPMRPQESIEAATAQGLSLASPALPLLNRFLPD